MIFVFKTSVETKHDVKHLEPHIDKILPTGKWNFDLEDCDRILRIDCEQNIVLKITELLNHHKFHCKELE